MWPWALAGVLGVVVLLPQARVARQSFWASRDRWLWLLAWVGVVWLLDARHWPLACAWAAGLLRWRDHAPGHGVPRHAHELLPSLCTWAAIIGWWLLVQHWSPAVITGTAWLLTGCALVQSGAVVVEWLGRAGRRATEIRGLGGQRGLTGAVLALLAPFVWHASPWLMLGLLPSLLLTDSWLAYLALTAALGVYAPWTLGWTLPLLGLGGLILSRQSWRARCDRTPRGTSLDSFWQRVYSTAILLVYWGRNRTWLWGRGPDGSLDDLLDARYRHFPHAPQRVITGHVHNEYLEWAYDGGVLAVAAMLGVAWAVAGGLQSHDPWSAVAVAGAVLAAGTLVTKSMAAGVLWLTALAVVAR